MNEEAVDLLIASLHFFNVSNLLCFLSHLRYHHHVF